MHIRCVVHHLFLSLSHTRCCSISKITTGQSAKLFDDVTSGDYVSASETFPITR